MINGPLYQVHDTCNRLACSAMRDDCGPSLGSGQVRNEMLAGLYLNLDGRHSPPIVALMTMGAFSSPWCVMACKSGNVLRNNISIARRRPASTSIASSFLSFLPKA